MPFTIQSPIRGSSSGVPETLAFWATERGCKRPADVRRYLETIYRLAPALGLNADIMVGQSILETSVNGAPWASHWWQRRCNPAGIGITGDDNQNAVSRDFGHGEAAARAHLLHLHLYVSGATVPPGFLATEDPRWDAAVAAGFGGVATTLTDLTNRWAIDSQYAEKIAGRLDLLERAGLLRSAGGNGQAGPDPTPVTRKPYVLLVAGHRSFGDEGSPVERALTDDLAVAYQAAFRAAGYRTDWFQQIDADDDPTMTRGGLDGIALGCGRVLAAREDELSIMLDLHFNTTRSAVHVIVPHNRRKDGRGMLNSFYVQGRIADDLAANNPLDVAMAGAIAREIAAIPGMTLWRADGSGGSGVPGVMLESESGVGGNGHRLAMMGATAPYRFKAVRLTIEHGGTDDASKPDFFNRSAQASLRAITAILAARDAGGGGAGPDPDDGDGDNHDDGPAPVPALPAFLFGAVGDVQFDVANPVSTLWLATGRATGRYPRLVDVLANGPVTHYLFGDGSVIVADGSTPPSYLLRVEA